MKEEEDHSLVPNYEYVLHIEEVSATGSPGAKFEIADT